MRRSLTTLCRYAGIVLLLFSIALYVGFAVQWIMEGCSTPLGENMVLNEIILIPNILMFKPITLATATGILGYALTLESIRNPLGRVPRGAFYVIEAALIVVLFMSIYELGFNLMYWSSLIVKYNVSNLDINIDSLYSKFEYSKYSWNLVFATKFFLLLTSLSATSIYFINRWLRQA